MQTFLLLALSKVSFCVNAQIITTVAETGTVGYTRNGEQAINHKGFIL